jgi:hypothetical protein
MDMKQLITFACSLALIGACSSSAGTPTVQGAAVGNHLTSTPAPADATAKPVATNGTASTSANASASAAASADKSADKPARAAFGTSYREVTLPAGTVLPVDLETSVGSDISRVEQPVSGRLRRPVTVGGVEVLPAGTTVSGHVTTAQRPGRVKGRGLIAMRFTQLEVPGAGRTPISTATVSRLAPATKEKDALKIIAPAAAGAVIGRIAGGKGTAAKGALIGGAAGTGYVLSTRGKEVRLGKGANLAVRLTAPVTLRVPAR